MAAHRIDRINEEIKRELSALLRELKDPRIPDLTTVVAVKTTPDLKFCKVFVSCLDASKTAEAAKGLRAAGGFVRRQLSLRLKLRQMPQFEFVEDHSIERGVRMTKLIEQHAPKEEETDESEH